MPKAVFGLVLLSVALSGASLGGVFILNQKLAASPISTPLPQFNFVENLPIGEPQLAAQSFVCDQQCKEYIDEAVSNALAGSTPKPTSVTTKPAAPVTPSKQTTYIPLSGLFSTTNTNWVDATGTEVYIDVENDYGKNAYVTWEATLRTLSGSGAVYARLFDSTNSIAVAGSEVNVSSSGSFTQATSGQLALWRGKNLYKVQLRSLDSSEAIFGSGRIKVVY